MSKKIFKERHYNLGIVESYQPSKKIHAGIIPVIGTFSVKGMAVENMISQNRTKYSPEVWAQPESFGIGGKYIAETGQLKPTTLFGSIDHPIDDRADLLLKEAAIAWYDVKRNSDGSWDGSADILDNPEGRLVKTFLDYAKYRGGGEMLGVSSRALGESVVSESTDGQYEAIVPESFELKSFDFVYNPSFQTAVANLNESKGKKVSLVESVRKLAEEDKEHAKYYEAVADSLEKGTQDVAKNNTKKESVIKFGSKHEEKGEETPINPVNEASKDEDLDALENELNEEGAEQDEEDNNEQDNDEETTEEDEETTEEDEETTEEDEESEEDDITKLQKEVKELVEMVRELKDFLMPIEDPEMELTDEEDPEGTDEESEEDLDQETSDILDELSEEDLEDLSDEELEYIAQLEV